ncbi:glycosyl hydrolase 5 family protein-like [Telopea speciosissima]|uniref:glycosyl hydrolase 5 family protein-like n=1 Tax=Telopea speciosissima TaxID=54955 RepID=UPI001CC38C19|nr:glycosyl hydrolase 5 family protein-like [Telopea speciosissima]
MAKNFFYTQFPFVVLLIISHKVFALPTLPLYTNSRWIVDEDGKRVKLACVNWAGHLPPLLAEGLSKQPLDTISKKIVSLGFNCVRLTWPTFMVTNDTLSSMTVHDSFQSFNLLESIAGLQVNNPSLFNITIVQALQEVVKNLGENNVMVILDNHVSKPMWCCNRYDGNGFFGDRYFNPRIWLDGLNKIATIFNGVNNVIGMSLRNELRGPRRNDSVWYNFMQKGAEVVHDANPNVLVILSGHDFDKNLGMLKNQPVHVSFKEKLVFEVHWYSFATTDGWRNGNPNDVCASQVQFLRDHAFFLLDQGYPLFMSEWGVYLGGNDVADNRYSSCAFALAAELDLDWALWALMGSYYYRENIFARNEGYGVLNWDWSEVRNPSFMERLSAIQYSFRGPGLSDQEQYDVIYHPLTGLCIPKSPDAPPVYPVKLGSCVQSEAWTYTPEKNLQIKDAYYCLQADGEGKPVKFGTDTDCKSPNAKWERISSSKFHFSTMVGNTTLCLDIDSNNTIVTNQCKCLTGSCEPASQWFHIIPSTIRYDS